MVDDIMTYTKVRPKTFLQVADRLFETQANSPEKIGEKIRYRRVG